MACDPSELINSDPCLQCLNEKQSAIVELQLLANILLAFDGSADVTPSGLMNAAGDFLGLNEEQRNLAEIGLLCRITEALA